MHECLMGMAREGHHYGGLSNLKRGEEENELKEKTIRLFYLNGCAEHYTE
jgi:hypothetical protein